MKDCATGQTVAKKREKIAALSLILIIINLKDLILIKKLEATIKSTKKLEEEIIFVLIVYETPKNPCSERGPIHKWFKENGYSIEEFRP